MRKLAGKRIYTAVTAGIREIKKGENLMGQIEKLAKALKITPEELVEKYKTDSLNLGQIAVIANFMDLSKEQTMKKFFPDFMYRRSLTRKERR